MTTELADKQERHLRQSNIIQKKEGKTVSELNPKDHTYDAKLLGLDEEKKEAPQNKAEDTELKKEDQGNGPLSINGTKEKAELKDIPKLNDKNIKFFKNLKAFIDDQEKIYENKIKKKEAEYKLKKWAIDKSKGVFKDFYKRLRELKKYKSDIEAIEKAVTDKGGNDLLTLMNVVHNEAGGYSSNAKLAVAYAYLNRIGYKPGDNIREPLNASEISHYSQLSDRWDGYTSDVDKLQFLKTIKSSFDSSNARFSKKGVDPTGGATHWVSPKGLKNAARKGYYQRTYEGITTYFPNWARSNEWVKKNPEQAKEWFDLSKFKEIVATGVDSKEFLFYTGVK